MKAPTRARRTPSTARRPRPAVTAVAGRPAVDEARLRMRDLTEQTGMSRQAIHFYIQQGLLPEGTKTSSNLAFYGPAHVERLRVIRQLQEERFLPLKTIRAVLDGDAAALSDGDAGRLLREVRAHLPASVRGTEAPQLVPLAPLLANSGVTVDDVQRMAELGLIGLGRVGRDQAISADDAWLIDVWGQVLATGFDRAHGFTVDDFVPLHDVMMQAFHYQGSLLQRMRDRPPEDLARMMVASLPLVGRLLMGFHTSAIRTFLASLPGGAASPDPAPLPLRKAAR